MDIPIAEGVPVTITAGSSTSVALGTASSSDLSVDSLTLGEVAPPSHQLDLGGRRDLKDAELEAEIADLVVPMRVLKLNKCKALTDLSSLSRWLPALEELDVSSCDGFGDAALRSLAEGCGGLRKLTLSRRVACGGVARASTHPQVRCRQPVGAGPPALS